jgi:chromosome segregation ATPase
MAAICVALSALTADRGCEKGPVVSFLSKYVTDFKKSWAETGEELGVAERKQRDRERRRRNFEDPVKTLTAEREEDKKLLEEAAGEIEKLQAERDKLAAERDQTQAELVDNKELLTAAGELAEQLLAERDQLAEVLKGPGVRKLLIRTYHSDAKAALSAAERKPLDAFTAKINTAYDLIDEIDKAAAEAAAQAKDEADSEE